jgi:hypothetical protein
MIPLEARGPDLKVLQKLRATHDALREACDSAPLYTHTT